MKRFLLIIACILNAVWASPQFSGSGTGTESDPYLIFNPIQLNQVRNFLNNNNVYFKLMADIDLNEWIADNNPDEGWVPIGTSSKPFEGKFDGNHHRVIGIIVNRTLSDYVGLFGYLSVASIKDMEIKGTVKGNNNVGGLCGYSYYGKISGVTFSGDVSGATNTGGLIGGDSETNISDCIFSGIVRGHNNTAGLIGYSASSIITGCVAKGVIYGENKTGGIIGYKKGKAGCYSITRSIAIVDINTTGDYTGGLVGYYYYGSPDFGNSRRLISDCSSIGNIISEGSYVGGLVGYDLGGLGVKYNYDYGGQETQIPIYSKW